ncbi:MAG TPA: glycosyltransferase [Blastocatellia bacterium]|nr:glycosyltransferase [Blastocatellia bacterium]
MGVSIVIPTWNGLGLLQRFLPSVIAAATHYAKHSPATTEILIVDDGSTDETVAWLLQTGFQENGGQVELDADPSKPKLRLLRNDRNQGFGEACNRGIEFAAHPLIFLLNNDVETAVDCIAPLVENFADASVFAAHCRVFEFDGGRECGTGKLGSFSRGFIRVHRSYATLDPPALEPYSHSAMSATIESTGRQRSADATKASTHSQSQPLYSMFAGGGSAMFDRQKFLDVGGFEPLLTPFYWEDVELSYRAWKRGYAVLYEPRSVTCHRVSSTIGRLNRRKVRTIEHRNRLIYHWIHLCDSRMLASHMIWVALLAITAPFRLRPGFLVSCAAALRRLPAIRKRRREEKRARVRNDREVFAIFRSMALRSDLMAYDDVSELNVE